jgi:malonate transporter and related proteins
LNSAFLALLPVLAVILLGFALRRTDFINERDWQAVDKLCYYVLFPIIIFKEVASADFIGMPVWPMASAMVLAILTMSALLFALRVPLMRGLAIDGPQFTSLFQSSTRWHAFMALSIIPIYFGQDAIALAGLAIAAMVPLLNFINVSVLALYGGKIGVDPKSIAVSVATNPYVWSSLGGLLWHAVGVPLPGLAVSILDVAGRGGLGLGLLTVGAGLRFEKTAAAAGAIALAATLKLVAMPVFMAVWLSAMGVTGKAAGVALLCGAVPSASGAYALAKRLGGDAGLIASALTLQVLLAGLTIPFVMWWLG